MRPLNNNRRVKQDPDLVKKANPRAIKDQTLLEGPPYVPAVNDNYKGSSSLRYSNGKIEENPNIRYFPRAAKVPYKEAKNMEVVPPQKDKFPQVQDGPAKNTRARKKMAFHADTTQEHFAYNINLEIEESDCEPSWEVKAVLGHNQKKFKSIHLKIEWSDGNKT